MFSDTHCHLPLVAEWIPTFSPSSFFASLCERKCSFLLDIGTKCDDILPRISFVQRALSPAGSSDMFAGTGGASAGTGDASTGTGGAYACTGGASTGTGGASAGTGSASAGTGGASTGTGGASAGTGSTFAGTSSALAGTSIASAGTSLSPEQVAQVCKMVHFSAGIWPSLDAIRARNEQMQALEKQIHLAGTETSLEHNNASFEQGKITLEHNKPLPGQNNTPFEHVGSCLAEKGVCAIGECGLDHHWNPSGVDGRCESDFDQNVFDGERELFLMQIELAKKLALPVIVHSRDAFQDTVDCIKEGGYDNGIIHCFSYSKEEAAVFLDRGWYIALGGSVTYTKKSKMDAMNELINYIPSERLLLETDAPYLAPVPFRGEPNTPLLIENTYAFIAEKRGMSVDKLCSLVDENAARLF